MAMLQTKGRQTAFDALRKYMETQATPEMQKSTMAQLQKMGIGQSPVGAELMRKNLAGLMSQLTQYGGGLAREEAVVGEQKEARREEMGFRSREAKKQRDWQQAIMQWQAAEQKTAVREARKRQQKQKWMGLATSAGMGALTGGLMPSLLGVGAAGGAGLGAMFGGAGMAGLVGKRMGIQQLMAMLQGMGGGGEFFGSSPIR